MAKKAVLGILAGAGELPLICAREVLRRNIPVRIFLVAEEEIRQQLAYQKEFANITEKVSLGKFGALLKTFQKHGITDLVLLGKVRKEHIFRGLRYDWKALSVMATMRTFNDDEFFRVMLREFQKIGITVIPQARYLQSLLLPEGNYTRKKPSKKDEEDIHYGLYYARKIGELDIGQTVIVRNKAVLAIEAIEGTDACIERAGQYSHGKGGIVCKAEKKFQDPRFDMPTVGISTLLSMYKARLHVLAIESNKTFVVNPPEFIQKANELSIIVAARRAPRKL